MLELFAHPEWARALGLLVAAAILALGAARAVARRRRHTLMGPEFRPAPSLPGDTLLALALVAIAVALLGLRWGEQSTRVLARGVDVVFLLDVSRSMDASDVPPSRLARAQRGVAELLARLEPQDRAALAVFGSRGALLTPLTPDRAALLEFTSSVDTDLIHPAGSHLASGLSESLQAFARGSDRSRVIFVLSDGERPQRGGRADAAELVRAQVRVLAAALGTDVGATVPDHGVPLRDAAGRIVHTRRDAQRLAHLADATDGQLFLGDAWGVFDFDAAASAIRRDAVGTHGEWVERRVAAVRVAPFAAVAFVLLCLEGLPARQRVWRVLTGCAAGATVGQRSRSPPCWLRSRWLRSRWGRQTRPPVSACRSLPWKPGCLRRRAIRACWCSSAGRASRTESATPRPGPLPPPPCWRAIPSWPRWPTTTWA